MREKAPRYIYISDDNREQVIRILKKLIFQRRTKWLSALISSIFPASLALLWPVFSEHEQEIILGEMSSEQSALFLTELDDDDRSEIFKSKNTQWILDRLEELDSDDIVDILKSLNEQEANFIIRKFDKEYSEKIKKLLNYKEGTAGSLMTTDFLAVRENAKLETIIRQFRRAIETEKLDDIHFVYVVDKQFKLTGYIPLRVLILQPPDKTAFEVMKPPIVTVTPDIDQEEVGRIFRDYDLITLPVVNEDDTMLGRITIDDVVDVLSDEASEDLLHLGGVHGDEDVTTPALTSVRRRMPWLAINLSMQALSAWIVTFFEPALSSFVLLAPLMTIVSGQGGNTAVQSISVIVRSLATGTLQYTNVFHAVLRQALIGGIAGILNGIFIGILVYLYKGSIVLSLVLFSAMTANMLLAGFAGTLVPLTLKKMKIDPALASGPLVTTMTDIFGFTSFLGLATLLLQYIAV